MKILFLTSGKSVPASRFRIQQFVPHLSRLGHHCVVAASHPPKYEYYRIIGWRASTRLRRFLRRVDWLRARLGHFDAVFLERELFNDDSYDIEQQIRRVCRTLVLDIDDAVFLRFPKKFQALVSMADAVVAGNENLRDKASPWNEHVTVVPTCVDLDRYTSRPGSEGSGHPIVVGWTGTAANLDNLRLIEEPLRDLAAQREFELKVIAEASAPVVDLNLEGVRWSHQAWREASEIEDLHQFDIGIMPLTDTDWNRYKCGLKIIQYMGVGIPAVASPVGVNSTIIEHGKTGFLIESARAWRDALLQLIDVADLRLRIGKAARSTIQERYSVEGNLPLLMRALEEAVRRTR